MPAFKIHRCVIGLCAGMLLKLGASILIAGEIRIGLWDLGTFCFGDGRGTSRTTAQWDIIYHLSFLLLANRAGSNARNISVDR